VIACILGGICAYTFSSIGEVCSATRQKTFKGCGAATHGPILANAMAITCIAKTLLACLASSIVIADSSAAILRSFGVPDPFSSRSYALLGTMGLIVFPMCLIKDLSVLGYTSLAGIGGIHVSIYAHSMRRWILCSWWYLL